MHPTGVKPALFRCASPGNVTQARPRAILKAMSEVDQAVVEELVGNAHGNLARVRELLDAHPAALNMRAPWNETAVEAAAQMGNKPILDLLLARGAPLDFFTACVLGRVEQVAAVLGSDPCRR